MQPNTRLTDYVLDMDDEEDMLLTTAEEPASVGEAQKTPCWRKAMH